MKPNTSIRIGIIYLAIGIYDKFWKDFYPSCEANFCTDAIKGYEVFTDSKQLLSLKLDNVCFHFINDRGFIRNVSAKSECIFSIAEKLKQKYDFIFYLNGNFKILEVVTTNEIIPQEENNFLTILSFNFNRNRDNREFPYDRNPDCQAYIPFGKGVRYYQGGFYGGRTTEVILMSEWIKKQIDYDLKRKVIARWHDESYINRYLLDKNPKLLDETYAFAEEVMPYRPHKMILLDKRKYLGEDWIQFKDLSIDNSISFLLDENLKPRKIGIVHGQGRLGNQMFQYAYLLYLKKKTGKKIDIFLFPKGFSQLIETFPNLIVNCLDEYQAEAIRHANPKQVEFIKEQHISQIENRYIPQKSITHYIGYWQCCLYVEEVRNEIYEAFSWQTDSFDVELLEWTKRIKEVCSVSIHIRRGDYLSSTNLDVYGKVCTLGYYQRAMQQMRILLKTSPTFFLFSDDKEWVGKYFVESDCIIVDREVTGQDWNDLYLMTLCKHHIISNSSFSWWGAWLGSNADKIVIAPEWWYYGLKTPDLLPPDWIKLPIEKEPQEMDCMNACSFFGIPMERTHKGLINEIDKIQLENTARHFHRYGSYLNSIGLLEGKTGLMIFFFHVSRYSGNKIYEEYAMELFDEIVKDISINTPIGFAHGTTGIGWGISYLINSHFVEGDINEILEDIDRQIMQYDLARIEDTSLETGLEGIALYLNERFNNPAAPYDNKYKKNLEKICQDKITKKPYSPIQTVLKALLHHASPFPTASCYCWQKELIKLFDVEEI